MGALASDGWWSHCCHGDGDVIDMMTKWSARQHRVISWRRCKVAPSDGGFWGGSSERHRTRGTL